MLSLSATSLKLRLNREQRSFTVNTALFPNTPERLPPIKILIHLLFGKLRGERVEEKILFIFSAFLMRSIVPFMCPSSRCPPSLPTGRKQLQRHKGAAQITPVTITTARPAVRRTIDCHLKLLTENVQKKSITAHALLQVLGCLVCQQQISTITPRRFLSVK